MSWFQVFHSHFVGAASSSKNNVLQMWLLYSVLYLRAKRILYFSQDVFHNAIAAAFSIPIQRSVARSGVLSVLVAYCCLVLLCKTEVVCNYNIYLLRRSLITIGSDGLSSQAEGII